MGTAGTTVASHVLSSLTMCGYRMVSIKMPGAFSSRRMFCLLVLGESPHFVKTAVTSALVTVAFSSSVAA
eukprot:1629394-Prorocentrum_lima.AAC.1